MSHFADIILPIPIKDTFTFSVPSEMRSQIQRGHRVEVQFGPKKKYSGIVKALHDNQPTEYSTKPILNLLDEAPIIDDIQLKFWQKIADYYVCTLGEVMNAALPAGIKLNSETTYVALGDIGNVMDSLEGDEAMIAEAFLHQNELRHKDLESILSKKSIHIVLKSLLSKGIIAIKENLVRTYKLKMERYVLPCFDTDSTSMDRVFERVKNAAKQAEIILLLVQALHHKVELTTKNIETQITGSAAPIKSLINKGLVTIEDRPVSRQKSDQHYDIKKIILTPEQDRAIKEITFAFKEKNVVLLHGITGSGKTLIYLKMIEEVINNGGQVLYLVPEIALTTQLVTRMAGYFGNQAGIYHSSVGVNSKIDLWYDVSKGKPLVIGARSGIFLPFKNLQLIIIDEEHDNSFKQNEPTPKYHARESAIMLAMLTGAKTLLGSATPSLETFHNAVHQKFGLVTLNNRYGNAELPEVLLLDRKTIHHSKDKNSHFSPVLIKEILNQLEQKRQVILFQNRRGFSATLSCPLCDWAKKCRHCDVSMTYHKFNHTYLCHYCGWSDKPDKACPGCGNVDLVQKGLGTEKIEEEVSILFPEANVARMDIDTVRGKAALSELLYRLETGSVDILIGTQMVTKGLDFENIGLVGVISADQLARFPDFRAHERAFQLMVQVSGRSGRSSIRGKVLIQYENIQKGLLELVMATDYEGFYKKALEERQAFRYPPFCRLIKLQVRHQDPRLAESAAEYLTKVLSTQWQKRIIGPAPAIIPRINNKYIFDILIKIEKSASVIALVKNSIREAILDAKTSSEFRSVLFTIDVDPQ